MEPVEYVAHIYIFILNLICFSLIYSISEIGLNPVGKALIFIEEIIEQ